MDTWSIFSELRRNRRGKFDGKMGCERIEALIAGFDMAMQDDIQQFGKELIQWQGPRVLGFEQTLDLLQSEHRQIRMWAVYQLIECWQERAAEFVHLLLESEIAESREAAIYLVGRYHLKQFAFPILACLIVLRVH